MMCVIYFVVLFFLGAQQDKQTKIYHKISFSGSVYKHLKDGQERKEESCRPPAEEGRWQEEEVEEEIQEEKIQEISDI